MRVRTRHFLPLVVAIPLSCSSDQAGSTSTSGDAGGGTAFGAGGDAGAGGLPPSSNGGLPGLGNGATSPGTSGSGGSAGSRDAGSTAGIGGESPDGSAREDASTDGGPPTDSGASTGHARDAGSSDGGDRDSGFDWGPGDYPPDVNSQTYLEISGVPGQNDYVRQYKVHVPPGYDPKKPAPLVFCIHGLAQNAVMFCVAGAAMDKKSDSAGFILVMPNGYQNSWNAGTCCGGASTEKLDDVALFRAIFAEVRKHVNVDPRRVYATGLSNGAYMSYRLACDASDLFVAVAPGSGAVGENDIGGGTNPVSDFVACEPKQHVSVLDVHGTGDLLVPYSLQAPSLAKWVEKDGCGSTTTVPSSPPSGGDTACVTYSGCPSGIEVTGCTVTGGGHCWFGSPDCGTGAGAIGAAVVGANSNTMVNTDAAWAFFERHHR
jgi:polyhydroxybutyrate depolymerase